MIRSRHLEALIAPAFDVRDNGKDLAVYEDGTQKPDGADAEAAALLPGSAGLLAGSRITPLAASATETRSWTTRPSWPIEAHRTGKLRARGLCAAPLHALGRGQRRGPVFAAFGCSFDAFEAQLRRMSGAEDGIVDALFGFTELETGACFWCPPVANSRVDLRAIGL